MSLDAVPTGAPLADEEALQRTATIVVAALKGADVPFALTGGCAVYARGGPPTTHDVDVLVCEDRAKDAVDALVAAGLTAAEPPEDWLTKAFCGDWLVDIIYRPSNRPVTPETLAQAEELAVGAVHAPVMPATAVMSDKLLVLGPHRCDLSELLPVARALREQVDWRQVADETAQSPYAEAFLFLARRLDIITEGGTDER
jgi:hypothetical protein